MGRGGRPWRGVKVVVIYSVLCNHVYLAFLHVCFYVFCFTILPISGREYALKNYKNCIKNTKYTGETPNIYIQALGGGHYKQCPPSSNYLSYKKMTTTIYDKKDLVT